MKNIEHFVVVCGFASVTILLGLAIYAGTYKSGLNHELSMKKLEIQAECKKVAE